MVGLRVSLVKAQTDKNKPADRPVKVCPNFFMSDLNYKCSNPKCGMELLNLNPTSPVTQKPEIDDLLICGSCSSINVVTLVGTRIITT